MRSRTYRFTEKDPVCGEIMTMVDEVGLRGKQHIGKIAILATKAYGTIEGILYGDTKRPQNATIMSIATALGFVRTWARADRTKFDVEAELTAARAYIKAERKRMANEGAKRVVKKKKKGKTLREIGRKNFSDAAKAQGKKPNLRLVKAA